MTNTRALLTVILAVSLVLSAVGFALAQQAGFSLAAGQAVAVSSYTLRYTGLTADGWPSYQLIGGGGVIALPSNPLPSICCDYHYGNVSVVTTSVAPDGAAVAGIVTIR